MKSFNANLTNTATLKTKRLITSHVGSQISHTSLAGDLQSYLCTGCVMLNLWHNNKNKLRYSAIRKQIDSFTQ